MKYKLLGIASCVFGLILAIVSELLLKEMFIWQTFATVYMISFLIFLFFVIVGGLFLARGFKLSEKIRAKQNLNKINTPIIQNPPIKLQNAPTKLPVCPFCKSEGTFITSSKISSGGIIIIVVGVIFTPVLIGIIFIIIGVGMKEYHTKCSACQTNIN